MIHNPSSFMDPRKFKILCCRSFFSGSQVTLFKNLFRFRLVVNISIVSLTSVEKERVMESTQGVEEPEDYETEKLTSHRNLVDVSEPTGH